MVRVAEVADFVSDDVVDAGRRGFDEDGVQKDDAVLACATPTLRHRSKSGLGCGKFTVGTPRRPLTDTLHELNLCLFTIPSVNKRTDSLFFVLRGGDDEEPSVQRHPSHGSTKDFDPVLPPKVAMSGSVDESWESAIRVHVGEPFFLGFDPRNPAGDLGVDVCQRSPGRGHEFKRTVRENADGQCPTGGAFKQGAAGLCVNELCFRRHRFDGWRYEDPLR